jgi:hypothetical protein
MMFLQGFLRHGSASAASAKQQPRSWNGPYLVDPRFDLVDGYQARAGDVLTGILGPAPHVDHAGSAAGRNEAGRILRGNRCRDVDAFTVQAEQVVHVRRFGWRIGSQLAHELFTAGNLQPRVGAFLLFERAFGATMIVVPGVKNGFPRQIVQQGVNRIEKQSGITSEEVRPGDAADKQGIAGEQRSPRNQH